MGATDSCSVFSHSTFIHSVTKDEDDGDGRQPQTFYVTHSHYCVMRKWACTAIIMRLMLIKWQEIQAQRQFDTLAAATAPLFLLNDKFRRTRSVVGRLLLSKRLIYYFWPENINQSHCSSRKRLFRCFVFRTRGWIDGQSALTAERNRTFLAGNQISRQEIRKEKLLQFMNVPLKWTPTTSTLLDDETVRSAWMPILCMQWCGINLILEITTKLSGRRVMNCFRFFAQQMCETFHNDSRQIDCGEINEFRKKSW